MQTLWWLLPDEALVLVIAALGCGVMVGLVRPAAILWLLALLVLGPFIGLVADQLLAQLPPWLSIAILFFGALFVARQVFAAVFGRGVSDAIVGHLVGSLLIGLCRVALFPLRVVGRSLLGWLVR